MKGYLLLALTFTVAQALSHTPLRGIGNYNPGQYQAGQLGYSSPQLRISGRRDVTESIHQESGNLYGGQRDGRFLTRGSSGDSYRDLQYSARPYQRDFRGQLPTSYRQQDIRRFQDSNDAYGYGASRNPQISFNAPLANTRSYNPRLDATGNPQNEYRFY